MKRSEGPWVWRSSECVVLGEVKIAGDGSLVLSPSSGVGGGLSPAEALQLACAIIAKQGEYLVVKGSDMGDVQQLVEQIMEQSNV